MSGRRDNPFHSVIVGLDPTIQTLLHAKALDSRSRIAVQDKFRGNDKENDCYDSVTAFSISEIRFTFPLESNSTATKSMRQHSGRF